MINSEFKRGFSYFVNDDQLHRYKALSPKNKIKWLESTVEFINKVAPPETKKLHKLFREGKI